MNEVLFLKGEDVTVTADGVTLGGVTAAECGEKTEWETYGEILTDIPVARYGKMVYIIKLTLNAQPYGSLGLSPEVSRRADLKLSFSAMTFPHQMMRVILLEQIYRSFKIIRHETYHK